MDLLGHKPTDYPAGIVEIVERAWLGGVFIQSDFARSSALLVATAASAGLITTEEAYPGVYGRIWRPTPAGLSLLWTLRGMEH